MPVDESMNSIFRSARRASREGARQVGVGTVAQGEQASPANARMNAAIRDRCEPYPGPAGTALDAVVAEYNAAVASGNSERIAQADRRLELLLAEARAAAQQPEGDSFISDIRRRATHRRGLPPQ